MPIAKVLIESSLVGSVDLEIHGRGYSTFYRAEGDAPGSIVPKKASRHDAQALARQRSRNFLNGSMQLSAANPDALGCGQLNPRLDALGSEDLCS